MDKAMDRAIAAFVIAALLTGLIVAMIVDDSAGRVPDNVPAEATRSAAEH